MVKLFATILILLFYPVVILPAQQISASGFTHTLYLCPSGKVYAWGDNQHRQLGIDTFYKKQLYPVPTTYHARVTKISAGGGHSLSLDDKGQVWGWGSNSRKAITDSNVNHIKTPVRSNMDSVIAIAAGVSYTLVLKHDSSVWAWGYNNEGLLGNGTTENSNEPVLVLNLENVVSIASGLHNSLALRNDGTVWLWGSNSSGSHGNGNFSPLYSTKPVQANIANIQSVSTGGIHVLALDSNGSVWSWGNNRDGELGYDTIYQVAMPVNTGLNEVTAISASWTHSLALKEDGTVWAWGRNRYGQLGDSTTESRYKPERVQGLENIAAIEAGYRASFAIAEDGALWAWGWNTHGQLGTGDTIDYHRPVKVPGFGPVSQTGPVNGPEAPVTGTAQNYTTNELPNAYTYRWTAPPGWSINSGQSGTSVSVTPGITNGKLCVTAENACGQGTPSCIQVAPTLFGVSDTTLCEGETLVLEVHVPPQHTIHWNTGETSESINVLKPGVYSATLQNDSLSITDSITVNFGPRPTVYIGPDSAFCGTVDYLIDPETQHAQYYKWNTGDTTKMLYVDEEGIYSLRIESKDACTNADTTEITKMRYPSGFDKSEKELCDTVAILDAGNPGASYLWNTGDTTQTITITDDGIYTVKIANGFCSIDDEIRITFLSEDDCITTLWMPNAFSPNGDGLNDTFGPVYQNIEEFHMSIYNRWGMLLYTSDHPAQGWDGTINGEPAKEGVYIYMVTYQSEEEGISRLEQEQGSLKLIR